MKFFVWVVQKFFCQGSQAAWWSFVNILYSSSDDFWCNFLNLLSPIVYDLSYSCLCYFACFFRNLSNQLYSEAIYLFYGLIDSISTSIGKMLAYWGQRCVLAQQRLFRRYFSSLLRCLVLVLTLIFPLFLNFSKKEQVLNHEVFMLWTDFWWPVIIEISLR